MIADWALRYATRLGWAVFPVHSMRPDGRCSCLDRTCDRRAKHPRTQHGVDDATTDTAQIAEWWRRWPQANIGLAGGAAWWVLDVDDESALATLSERFGWRHSGPVARTGGGGLHLFFAPDTRAANRVRIKLENIKLPLDVRGAGGYVLGAPSNHESGGRYRWEVPPTGPLPAAPDWLIELVSVRATTIPAPPPVACSDAPDLIKRASRYLATLEPSISGSGGHLALWRAAQVLVRRFGLTRDQAMWLLVSEYNPRCQPPWSEKELEHKVRNAIDVGRMSPIGK